MSLLSINRRTVYLAPSGVAALLRPKFGRAGVKTAFHQDASHLSLASGEPDFAALSLAVRALGGGPVEVILSSAFVRYQRFSWQESLKNREEELGYARFSFAQTYGGAVEKWQIALSDEAPGMPRIAAAIDAALLSQLAESVQEAGGELVSVRPSLIAALNFWLPQLDNTLPTWFLLYESGGLALVLLEDGVWKWVRNRRVKADWAQEWSAIIAEESMLRGSEVAHPRVVVFSPEQRLAAGESVQILDLRAKREACALKDPRFEFAWLGH